MSREDESSLLLGGLSLLCMSSLDDAFWINTLLLLSAPTSLLYLHHLVVAEQEKPVTLSAASSIRMRGYESDVSRTNPMVL